MRGSFPERPQVKSDSLALQKKVNIRAAIQTIFWSRTIKKMSLDNWFRLNNLQTILFLIVKGVGKTNENE